MIYKWMLEQTKAQVKGRVLDLNEFMRNFPGLDLIASSGAYSVKTYDVLAAQPGRRFYQYIVDFEKFYDQSELARMSENLDRFRVKIQARGGWPAALPRDASRSTIERFLRNEGVLIVPDDHVNLVWQRLGKRLYERGVIGSGKNRTYLRTRALSDAEVARRINDVLSRVQSSGISSKDLRRLLEVARDLVSAVEKVTRGKKGFRVRP